MKIPILYISLITEEQFDDKRQLCNKPKFN